MVGICAGFIAFLDLMHTLTFEGMDIIKDSNGLYAPQFWIATRWMEAVTLLVGFLFVNLKKKINSVFIFSCYFVATLLIFLSIVKWHIFPACFIPGKGLTPFKIYSEYAIIMVLLAALYSLYRAKDYFKKNIYYLLFASIIFAVLTELSFTLYASNFDVLNQIGHYSKLLTFYLMYKANVEEGIVNPAETLFKRLTESEKNYKEISDALIQKNEKFLRLNERYKIQNQLLVENEHKLTEINITKDKLFSIIAHDLRNLFTSLMGYSNLLSKNIDKISPEKTVSYAQIINNSSKQVHTLLENLLDWSRLQTGSLIPEFQPLSPLDIATEIQLQYKEFAASKNIDIRLDIAENALVYADREMVKTVLRNLVVNALKYTNTGGIVTIKTENDEGKVLFVVSDNGVGIEPEYINKMFKVNNIVKPGTAKEKGTGLGLVLCSEFVHKNNGKIWVESTLGKGSNFKFFLNAYNYSSTIDIE